MRRFSAFVYKEMIHILRDRRTVMILLVMPIIQIILFGFALTNEVNNVRVAIIDNSQVVETQKLVNKIEQSEYFEIVNYTTSDYDIDNALKEGIIDAAIVFPYNFSVIDVDGNSADIQVIANAVDPNTSSVYVGYLSGIIQTFQSEIEPFQKPWYNIVPSVRLLYNPSMKSSFNFVPGVLGLILTLICAMMTAISIVREKERGSMEVLLVSPVKPLMIVLAKCVPYFALSFLNLCTVLLLAVFVLEVPIAGSLSLLVGVSTLFIFTTLGLGLMISSFADTQVTAMLASGMVLMMPTIALSGMMFPFENMPEPLQFIGCVIPTTWYISALRKIMIEGLPFLYVAKEFAILSAMSLSLVIVNVVKFKTRL